MVNLVQKIRGVALEAGAVLEAEAAQRLPPYSVATRGDLGGGLNSD